jgi:transcriptional regulator with XRE-family HTH domain
MKTSVYSVHYEKIRIWLKNARQSRGLSLRDVAAITGVHHSVYGKLEQTRRRIDIVEYVEYCRILEIDPLDGLKEIMISIDKTDNVKKQF